MTQNELLQIAVTLTGYRSMIDGIRINFDTLENVGNEILSRVLSYKNVQGFLLFKPGTVIDKSEIESIPEIKFEIDDKSPSRRLRDRMYVYYTHVISDKAAGFETFYREELSKIGQKYLDCMEK